MKIYVDCSETYKTQLNTGIQRVVRKIANHTSHLEGIEICPFIYDGIGMQKISYSELEKPGASILVRSHNLLNGTLFYTVAKWLFRRYHTLRPYFYFIHNRNRYIHLNPQEDIILVADIIRDPGYIVELQKLNRKGFKIYQIVFDILPLKYPLFFKNEGVEEFKSISSTWKSYTSKFYAISEKVAKELEAELQANKVDYFHLGSDFSKDSQFQQPTFILSNQSYFLCVGTIEPRKNHALILKTFLKLWEEGYDKNLVFVGRVGWNVKETLELIKLTENNYPNRFLWLDDLNDIGLESYYRNSEAVICASIDEGFGLPIVEALSRGRNVLCSDIEVFREVGTSYCTFFDFELEGKNSLLEMIRSNSFKKDISGFKWLTWQESVDMLISKIVKEYYKTS